MKHLSILLLSSVVMTASAVQHQPAKTPFTGFSFIAAAGGILGEANLMQEATGSTALPFPIAYTRSNRISESGVTGVVGMGYAHQFRTRLVLAGLFTVGFNYVAFEENAHAASSILDAHASDMQGKVKAELRNDFALFLKPGFAFQDTLVYGLIGPRWGNFKSTFNNDFSITIDGTPLEQLPSEAEQSAYHVGLAVGAGLSQKLWSHVLAGVEYQYTTYGNSIASFRAVSNGTHSLGTGYVAHGSVDDIHTNTLMATVAYQF